MAVKKVPVKTREVSVVARAEVSIFVGKTALFDVHSSGRVVLTDEYRFRNIIKQEGGIDVLAEAVLAAQAESRRIKANRPTTVVADEGIDDTDIDDDDDEKEDDEVPY